MAKKSVASIQKGEGKGLTKVIKVVKSKKTGAYAFKETMIPNEKVQEFLKQK